MREGLLLGVDVGTTRIKAVVIDADGVDRASASAPTPFVASADGVDMEVADFGRALAAVIAALGPVREGVAAVGLAGLAESGAPFRAGRPIGPIIAWHDGRGEETVASLERRFGPDLARTTGRRVRTVSSLAKLGWLIDHGLPVPDRWLGVPELALFLLTGVEATEHSLAARTGAYDVVEGRFLPEVIAHVLSGPAPGGSAGPERSARPERVAGAGRGRGAGLERVAGAGRGRGAGLERVAGAGRGRGAGPERVAGAGRGRGAGLFPAVRAAGSAMGFVSGEGAGYGLPAGIPVTIAGHDHLAAAAGLGARPDDLLNSVGTAETLVRRLAAAPDVEQALALDLAVTVWPGGDAWAVLASAARSGLVIDALAAHLGMDPAALDACAARVGAGAAPRAAGSMSLPGAADAPVGPATGAAAEGAGPADRRPPGRILTLGQGIEVPAGPPAGMWTATLAALAGRTAAAAERVARLAGPHGRLVVFGGGSRSPAWLQAKAAAAGVPVVGCPVAEAAARGAALAAGAAAGWWPTPAAGPTPTIDVDGAAAERMAP